jgi:hypothetical protein
LFSCAKFNNTINCSYFIFAGRMGLRKKCGNLSAQWDELRFESSVMPSTLEASLVVVVKSKTIRYNFISLNLLLVVALMQQGLTSG